MVLVVLVVLRFSTFFIFNRCACLLWDGGSRGSRGSPIFKCFLFLNRMCIFLDFESVHLFALGDGPLAVVVLRFSSALRVKGPKIDADGKGRLFALV